MPQIQRREPKRTIFWIQEESFFPSIYPEVCKQHVIHLNLKLDPLFFDPDWKKVHRCWVVPYV